MRVIVTRPGPQALHWVSSLRAAGLDALALPLIEIAGPPNPDAVRAAWQRLRAFDALMFVSANAVQQFFALRPQGLALESIGPRFFVTGPGSAAALAQAGVPGERVHAPDAGAAQWDSEALWQVVQPLVQPDWRVLIVRGTTDGEASEASGEEKIADKSADTGVGRDWFAARLVEQGAAVEFLVAYQRRAPPWSANALALVQVAAVDGSVWLFSSSQAVTNLVALAPAQSWRQARALATHPRIAQAARAAGFGAVGESRPAIGDVLASIESLA